MGADTRKPELTVHWDNFGDELLDEGSGYRIWLASYPGCPAHAELCWQHGFQDVVRSWFNIRTLESTLEFDGILSDMEMRLPTLHHYIHDATSAEVLRLASKAL